MKSIRVYGDAEAGGYAVAAVAAEFRKDTVVVGEVAVSVGALGGPPAADSPGAAVWKAAYPFADDVGTRAILLVYGGMTAMICDTAFFATLRGGGAVSPQFREKLDILVVPPSDGGELLEARNRFRPRFVITAPPCVSAPARNILCVQPDKIGRWSCDFSVRGGKLGYGSDHWR